MAVAVDWLKIRNDYINGGGSYRQLAEKYNVKFSALREVAFREEWVAAKRDKRSKWTKSAMRPHRKRLKK